MSIKKFGKYLLIVFLLLIGLCAIGCLYLFFVPNSSLFGITYISYNTTYTTKGVEYTTETTSFSAVQINSRAYDVQIVTGSSSEISVEVYSNSLGFTLVKNSEVSISSKITSTGVLVFDITEPHGVTTIGSSYIKLRIPESISIDLTIENNSAITTINSSKLIIGNLYYVTNKGDLTISSCTLTGTIDLELNKGDFVIGKSVTLNGNDVLIEVTSGSFNSTECTLGTITINSNSNGVIKIGTCTTLQENIDSAGGRIEVTNLGSGTIRTSDSNIYIGTVTAGLNVKLTKSGSVEVTNANYECTLETNTGHILVTNATYPLDLISTDGNITVSSSTSQVTANSSYGTINVTYSNDAESYSEGNNARCLNATTKSGKIIASGVENVTITVEDNGRVELHMSDVIGTSSIVGARGDVYVLINAYATYNLTTKSVSGDVSVNLLQTDTGGITTRKENTINVTTDVVSTSNFLTISTTSGGLKVRDDKTINF